MALTECLYYFPAKWIIEKPVLIALKSSRKNVFQLHNGTILGHERNACIYVFIGPILVNNT